MNIIPVKNYIFGTIDTIEDTEIPRGAASKSLNWITNGGKIELRRGTELLGNEVSGAGKITTLEVVKTTGGIEIPLRTRGKKLEYYNVANETWTEIGSDILGDDGEGKPVSIQEYHPLSGDQIFVNSPSGPYLKIMMANLGSPIDIYDADKNHKCYIQIKQNRTFGYFTESDKTGVYLSKIDTQNFTTVTDENIGVGNNSDKTFNKTLAFKGSTIKTCFGITVTDGTENFKDNNDGTLTGDKGGTGTINYATGVISVTFKTAPGGSVNVLCSYQHEDSTDGGIADFTQATPRVTGEGTTFRQDDGGGNILNIFSYGNEEYCMHEKKTYVLNIIIDGANETATNLIYREKMGMPNRMAGVATAEGIYYIDNSDNKDPQLKVITISQNNDLVIPKSVSKKIYKGKMLGIDLSAYEFDKCTVREWGDLILICCRTSNSTENNRTIVYNKRQDTFDTLDYAINAAAVYYGTLIVGDPASNNVYTLFSGFDDDDSLIPNSWEGNRDTLDFIGLKKDKKLVIKGLITIDQEFDIFMSLDNGPYVKAGTVAGNAKYVDRNQGVSVGRVTLGRKVIGGGSDNMNAYYYETEIKLILDKFETIKTKYVAKKIGYVSVFESQYKDIRYKNNKIPKKYR